MISNKIDPTRFFFTGVLNNPFYCQIGLRIHRFFPTNCLPVVAGRHPLNEEDEVLQEVEQLTHPEAPKGTLGTRILLILGEAVPVGKKLPFEVKV